MVWFQTYHCGCFTLVNGRPRYLPQVQVDIHATIVDIATKTRLTQQFLNPYQEDPIDEINYVFPLYDGVSVVSFTCTLDDRIIKGVVKERQQAKQDYYKAKAEGRTAGLLEQCFQASDVFVTTIGNVPAGGKVVVEIVYIGELKHDAETDQVRLTIPTHIAPRYGSSGIETKGVRPKEEGISMTVDVEMPQGSFIKSLASPSHPIAVSIGTLSTAKGSSEHSLNKASAVLSQPESSINYDFVIEVTAVGLNEPTAFLETHPTIPNQRALMATLVPKFKMPVIELPEIIFLCDRSGSMETKISSLVVALTTFLKSLPVGIKFNIYSFGTSYTSLWPRSRKYDQETLEQAVSHINTFQANYYGTEMYQVMDAAFKNAYKDLNVEVFLLTDGEIWNQNALFQLITDQVASTQGRIRVFSLGIGSGASSALVEGVARAGNGFAQMVLDNERMDNKVIRMLRGSLLPHINDYSLEIKYESSGDSVYGEESFEIIERVMDSLHIRADSEKKTTVEKANLQQVISLFDPNANIYGDISGSNQNATKANYDHLPTIEAPRYLQTPTRIPQLYPFHRTTIYVLLSDATPEKTPKSVLLKGICQDITLELEIPIVPLPEKSSTIHQLAVRNEIKDLEEGRGWLFKATDDHGKYLKDKFDGKFSDMIEREAVRLGVQFQVAGKHCSFVAVEEPTSHVSSVFGTEQDEPKKKRARMTYRKANSNAYPDASIGLLHQHVRPLNHSFAQGAQGTFSGTNSLDSFPMYFGGPLNYRSISQCDVGSTNNPDNFPMDFRGPLGAPSGGVHSGDILDDFDFDSFIHDGDGNNQPFDFNGLFPSSETEGIHKHVDSKVQAPAPMKLGNPQESRDIQSLGTSRFDKLHSLISLQTFAGSWVWEQNLENVLGIAIQDLLDLNLPISAINHIQKDDIIATACVIFLLKRQYSTERDSWEMLVEKADRWLQEQVGGDAELLKIAVGNWTETHFGSG